MAKLSDEEAAQLKALQDKQSAPDEPEGGPGGDGVIVLVGKRADDFLGQVFGTPGPRKAAAPPAKKAAKKAAPPAAADPDDGDDDEPGEDDPVDPPPPTVNRYFR